MTVVAVTVFVNLVTAFLLVDLVLMEVSSFRRLKQYLNKILF